MKPRSYVEKDRMLRASVRCQFKCIRCEGVRGRSAAGPPSLSSTLLRYYASIVHIFYIYIHIIFYIYISTYTWTYHCLYEAEGTEAKRTEKIYIYTHIPFHSINLYIYIYAYIYEKNTYTWYYKVLAFFGAIFFLLSRMVLSSLLTFSSTPYY